MQARVRALKARGETYAQIAAHLGISYGMAHYYGKPMPGEKICSGCCRKFAGK